MDQEKTIRGYFHLILNELNVLNSNCGNVELMAKKLKEGSNPLEFRDFVLEKIGEIKANSKVVNDAVLKIKTPNYMLIDVDLSFEDLDEEIKKKYQGFTIHVVENDPKQCEWYEQVLSKRGFSVSFSKTFNEASELFKNGHRYFIVILNAQAHSQGNQALEDMLKIIEKYTKSHVVVVSSESDPAALQRIRSSNGVLRTIPNPPTDSVLESAVSMALLKSDSRN